VTISILSAKEIGKEIVKCNRKVAQWHEMKVVKSNGPKKFCAVPFALAFLAKKHGLATVGPWSTKN
jgi:hypothetical protein